MQQHQVVRPATCLVLPADANAKVEPQHVEQHAAAIVVAVAVATVVATAPLAARIAKHALTADALRRFEHDGFTTMQLPLAAADASH